MQDVTPGIITYTKPSAQPETSSQQQASYKPSDLHEGNLKLRAGDKVEFSLASAENQQEDEGRATDITLVARAASVAANDGLQHGCIVAVKEGFGFIRYVLNATCSHAAC